MDDAFVHPHAAAAPSPISLCSTHLIALPLVSRRPRKSLVQVRREAVPQLAGVGGQVDGDLLQLVGQHARRRLVARELPVHQALPLLLAADDSPHQQVRHVDGDRLRQPGELGGVVADRAGVALGVQRQDFQGAYFLVCGSRVSTGLIGRY